MTAAVVAVSAAVCAVLAAGWAVEHRRADTAVRGHTAALAWVDEHQRRRRRAALQPHGQVWMVAGGAGQRRQGETATIPPDLAEWLAATDGTGLVCQPATACPHCARPPNPYFRRWPPSAEAIYCFGHHAVPDTVPAEWSDPTPRWEVPA